MNGIEGGVELVTTSGLTHLSTPVSIYTLKLYIPNGNDEMALIQCACGCGTWIEDKDKRGRSRRFVNNHHRRGKHFSEATIRNFRESRRGRYVSEETKREIGKSSAGRHHSEETIRNFRESRGGVNNPNWRGGISFEPYCYKFNNALKEEIRDRFGRVCFLCPKTEEENGQKLSVHHCDYNKMQGCNGIRWLLVPLCVSCNFKVNYNREYWQDFITEKLIKDGKLIIHKDELSLKEAEVELHLAGLLEKWEFDANKIYLEKGEDIEAVMVFRFYTVEEIEDKRKKDND